MDMFRCETLRCSLTRRACIARQECEFTVRGTGEVRRHHQMEMCDPKRCAQGAAVREELKAAGLLEDLVEDVRRRARQFRYQPRKKAAPVTRELVSPPISAPAPAAAVVHEAKEETVLSTPDKSRPCTTPGCSGHTQFAKLGICRRCYEQKRREKANGPMKRCACGATIRKTSPFETCPACRPGAAPAPAKPVRAVTVAPAPVEVARPDGNVGEYFAALSNGALAEHIAAALAERTKRLSAAAGLEALRAAIPTAA